MGHRRQTYRLGSFGPSGGSPRLSTLMSGSGGEGLALGLALLGGILIVLEGLVDAVRGAVFLAVGRTGIALGTWSQSLLFVLLGIVLIAVAVYGHGARSDGSRAAGLVLVLIPVLGFFLFGFLNGVLVLLGAVLVLVAGVVFLTARR
jgi:hypothetical protein